MLREGTGITGDDSNGASHGTSVTWDAPRLDWRAVDRALRDIARRRAKLDADEASWLREAEPRANPPRASSL